MNKIALTHSQKIGADLLAAQLNQARSSLNEFLLLCLEEGGGKRTEPWIYNDQTKEWNLNADGNANEGTAGKAHQGVAG